jgi:cytoskeleton protein RodZ
MKLEIADVATRLRLSGNTIEHLESDSYNQLPGRTFARGYLRNYARMLGQPLEPVLAEFDRLVPRAPSATSTATRAPPAGAKKPQPQHLGYAMGVAVAALLLLAAWWQMPRDQDNSEPEPALPRAVEPLADDTSQPVPKMTAPEDEPVTPPGSLANINTADANQTSATTAAAPEEVGLPTATHSEGTLDSPQSRHSESEDTLESPQSTQRAGSDGELRAALTAAEGDPTSERVPPEPEATERPADSLRLRLAHDSWIEVYDESGARLYYDLAKDGDNIALLGAAPFRLVVGYARDIDIDYNGAPFDPTRYINRDGLARFTLGDVEPAENTPTR